MHKCELRHESIINWKSPFSSRPLVLVFQVWIPAVQEDGQASSTRCTEELSNNVDEGDSNIADKHHCRSNGTSRVQTGTSVGTTCSIAATSGQHAGEWAKKIVQDVIDISRISLCEGSIHVSSTQYLYQRLQRRTKTVRLQEVQYFRDQATKYKLDVRGIKEKCIWYMYRPCWCVNRIWHARFMTPDSLSLLKNLCTRSKLRGGLWRWRWASSFTPLTQLMHTRS
jgi:hypothetical protein